MLQVGAAVITRTDLILACQRRTADRHPGKWEFPGGKRHDGETLAACVVRELREELAITATVGAEIWRTRHYYRDNAAVEVFFHWVNAYEGTIANLAFADVCWVRFDQLATLDFLDADRALVAWLATRR